MDTDNLGNRFSPLMNIDKLILRSVVEVNPLSFSPLMNIDKLILRSVVEVNPLSFSPLMNIDTDHNISILCFQGVRWCYMLHILCQQ